MFLQLATTPIRQRDNNQMSGNYILRKVLILPFNIKITK